MIYRYGLGAVLVLTLFSACKLKRASVSPAAVSRLDPQAQDQQTVSAPASIPKVDWDEDDDQDFDKNSKFYLIEQNQLGLVQPVRPVRRFKGELDVIGWKIKEATARNNRDQGKPGDPVSSREEASPQKISYKNSKGIEKVFDTESADSIKWEGEGADQPKFVLLLEKDPIKFLQSIPKDFYVEELVSYHARGWSSFINWFTNSPRIFRIQKLTAVVEKRVKKLADMGVTFPYPWIVKGLQYNGLMVDATGVLTRELPPDNQISSVPGAITPKQLQDLIKHYRDSPSNPEPPFEVDIKELFREFKKTEKNRLLPDRHDDGEWMYQMYSNDLPKNRRALDIALDKMKPETWIKYPPPRPPSPASPSSGGSSAVERLPMPTSLPDAGRLIDQPSLGSDNLKVEEIP